MQQQIKLSREGLAGYVYLMHVQGTNRFKIGETYKYPANRESELNRQQAAFPIKLINWVLVENRKEVEKYLHTKYKKFRIHGEYFEFNGSLLKQVIADYAQLAKFKESASKPKQPNKVIDLPIKKLSQPIKQNRITTNQNQRKPFQNPVKNKPIKAINQISFNNAFVIIVVVSILLGAISSANEKRNQPNHPNYQYQKGLSNVY